MLEVKGLTKIYKPKKGVPVRAVNGVDLKIENKGMVFILGKSGSGKSTLLNLLGGLDRYDEGEIIIKGKSSKSFSQAEFDSYRNTYVGFIFQEYNILNEFSVGANIALAMELQGKKATPEALSALLETVDLAGYANRKPNELSGGQKQRVAIARALIKDPEIIMADEPTGALDSNTGKQVFETLQKLSKEKLVIIVSHDREFAEYYGDRVIEMADGKIVSDIVKYKAESSQLSDGVSVIEDKILHIKKGYSLTADDLKMINGYLERSESDTIISIDEKANVDFKKSARIDNEGNRDAFKSTSEKDVILDEYGGDSFKLIKSKLPVKNAFKIGASGLKTKPFRLFFTILLSAIAFGLFGLVDTLAAYDKATTAYNSIIESEISYLAFSKTKTNENGDNSYSIKMSADDISALKQKFPNLMVLPVTDSSLSSNLNFSESLSDSSKLSQTYFSFYKCQFSGIAEIKGIETLDKLGYDKLAGETPSATDEIMITKYVYEHFVKAGHKDYLSGDKTEIKTYNDILGKNIAVSNNSGVSNYKICGIVDNKFDDSRYATFKDVNSTTGTTGFDLSSMLLQQEMNDVLNISPHAVAFTAEGFIEANVDMSDIGSYLTSTGNYYLSFYYIDGGNNYCGFYLDRLKTADSGINFYKLNGKTENTLLSDELYVDIMQAVNMYNSFNSDSPYNEWEISTYTNEQMNNLIETLQAFVFPTVSVDIQKYGDDYEETKKSFKVAGFFVPEAFSSFNYKRAVYVSDTFENYLKIKLETKNPYSFAVADMPQNNLELMPVVNFNFEKEDGVGYKLVNSVTTTLNSINGLLETFSKVFLYIGIGFAVFASLLMMNFISTSIHYKKREIGILRAVGARSNDVFSIFFSESFIIACINWVIALTLTAVTVFFLNSMLRTDYNFQLTLLNFGIRQLAFMFAVSVGCAFVSSFLPVVKIARKKPIDAIQNK